ncbi:MAG: DUF1573 domain-containing protein [Bacteroidota bacterium]
MKKTLLILTAFVLFISVTQAQKKPSIEFDKKLHDYGKILEEKGMATCKYVFKNTGNDTLYLKTVQPSCGCTTSDWTKGPVLPGKSGFISATYNPQGRPGVFNKTINVTTNDPANASIVLTIKGEVIPKPKSAADTYQQKSGNIGFVNTHLAFSKMTPTQIKTDTIKMYSFAKQDLNLSIKNLPAHLTAKIIPETLKPEKEGIIIISYNSELKKDFGFIYDTFTLSTNDSVEPEKRINVSAEIYDDFSTLTPEQKEKAAKIEFKNTTYNFGKVNNGEIVKYSFEFTNTGKSDLLIHKTKASCGCTASNPAKTTLKPGESSTIDISFNSTGRTGQQHKNVTVISNDPVNYNIVLNIEGEVLDVKKTEEAPK